MVRSPLEALELAEKMDSEDKATDSMPISMDSSTAEATTGPSLPTVCAAMGGEVHKREMQPVQPTPRMDHEVDRSKLQLELEMTASQKAALNQGTSANYNNYLQSYQGFCKKFGFKPFPLTEIALSMYAQFLSRSVKPQTIKQMVSALRTISVTAGYKVTEKQFPLVNLTIKGIGKLKPSPPQRAQPMTARILINIRNNLDLSKPFHATMWALFTTSFFLLLRKSNVTPDKEWENGYIHRKHIQFNPTVALVTLYWTKTIQAEERCLQFPLFEAPGVPICPVWALKNMYKIVKASKEVPAFCYRDGSPIMYATFNKFIKDQIKKLGMSDSKWSTHCFRRGGTSYLAACGVPERQIKLLGDWKSDCYRQYIHCPWQEKLSIATKVQKFLLSSCY